MWILAEGHSLIVERLRAKFWLDCAIPDTSMKFGTLIEHNRLIILRYRTTLRNARCACAMHLLLPVVEIEASQDKYVI